MFFISVIAIKYLTILRHYLISILWYFYGNQIKNPSKRFLLGFLIMSFIF
jgi:hypothetical protein